MIIDVVCGLHCNHPNPPYDLTNYLFVYCAIFILCSDLYILLQLNCTLEEWAIMSSKTDKLNIHVECAEYLLCHYCHYLHSVKCAHVISDLIKWACL